MRPQFTSSYQVGYKKNWSDDYLYASVYHKDIDVTITRIASTVPNSDLIYNIFQNAGGSHATGMEIIISHNAGKWGAFNLNLNGYQNIIEAFTVVNKYPQENTFSAARQDIFSGSVKLNGLFHLTQSVDAQFSAVYLAPDLSPQTKLYSRFYIDARVKKRIERGKGELFINATDIANTLRIRKTVTGDGFHYSSTDYYETQVVRVGYTHKFCDAIQQNVYRIIFYF